MRKCKYLDDFRENKMLRFCEMKKSIFGSSLIPTHPPPTPLSDPLVCIRSSSQQDHTSDVPSYHLSPSGEIAGESFSFLSDLRAPDDDRQIDGWMWFFYFSFIIELCSNISQEYMEVMTNSHWTQWWTVSAYLETLNIHEKKKKRK